MCWHFCISLHLEIFEFCIFHFVILFLICLHFVIFAIPLQLSLRAFSLLVGVNLLEGFPPLGRCGARSFPLDSSLCGVIWEGLDYAKGFSGCRRVYDATFVKHGIVAE